MRYESDIIIPYLWHVTFPRYVSNNLHYTHTEGHVKINSIIWKVPKFLDIIEDDTFIELHTGKSDDSKVELALLTEPEFQLMMRLLDYRMIHIFYLCRMPVFLKPKINLRNILTISLCCEQEETIIIEEEYSTVLANKWHMFKTLYKEDLDEIYSEKWKNLVSTKGTFILKFQYMDTNNIRVDHSNNPAQLTNDFEKLLTNGLFSDVVMKSAEGVEFRVHKAVLASRCAVIRAHFEHDTKECLTNTLESPFESDVLRDVLTFIYSDKSPNVDDNPKKLLEAADYYQLSRLKSLCEEALHKKLTVENTIETLQLADLHSANTLKQWTLQFIKEGQAKFIIKTELGQVEIS